MLGVFEIFALKDIESLKNLASTLTIPFFAAACILDVGLQAALDTLKNISHPLVQIGVCGFWLFIVVALVSMIFLLIDNAIVWLHVATGDRLVMLWVGFTSITAGIFICCYMLPKMPASPLNLFWHLGLLTYGLSLVSRAIKSVRN